MKQNNLIKKEAKVSGILGSLSGVASFLGGWQVCHNLCLGLIALLSIIGITVSGMPLFFLTKVAVPLWILAVFLFLVTLYFYYSKRCISKNLIILNLGFIIAGVPFNAAKNYSALFWIIGGTFVLFAIYGFIKHKLKQWKNYTNVQSAE